MSIPKTLVHTFTHTLTAILKREGKEVEKGEKTDTNRQSGMKRKKYIERSQSERKPNRKIKEKNFCFFFVFVCL